MCRRDFRVKVDLSNFYDDVRRSSWVYVDKDSISCICHLQKHISKVFDIQKSFHLLLGSGEYLPPNEDSRILKEDEMIVVVPGTGLQNHHSNSLKRTLNAQTNTNRLDSQQKQSMSDLITSSKVRADDSSDEENETTNLLTETTVENTVFLSMINDSQMEAESESKPEMSGLGESPVSETSPMKHKRKRVRRKKSKNAALPEEPVANEGVEFEYKKPKIINSVTIPNGKHIRFGDVERQELHGYDSSASNDSKKPDSKNGNNGLKDTYWDKPIIASSLSNLLALRHSSTPITFNRKKAEETVCQIIPETRDVKEPGVEETLVSKNDDHSLVVDPKKHPLMEGKARINDVIAFKVDIDLESLKELSGMLKMGNDYTPQVSEYIIAQPIQILSDRSTYMFKILEGQSEVQAPQGKFDLDTDETQNTETEVIALNWSQLIEPRLIYRG